MPDADAIPPASRETNREAERCVRCGASIAAWEPWALGSGRYGTTGPGVAGSWLGPMCQACWAAAGPRVLPGVFGVKG